MCDRKEHCPYPQGKSGKPRHRANAFEDPADYEKVDLRDELEIENFLDQIQAREVEVKDVTKGFNFKVKLDLTDNELEVVLCGGQLRYLKRELVKQGVIEKE